MKRIFVAVKVEPELKLSEMISSYKSILKDESIKWTSISNIHITLAFIGNTQEEKISAISSELAKSCEGFGKLNLKIKGSGVFKSLDNPHVIWAGIERSEELIKLYQSVKKTLNVCGVNLPDTPFRPHLTLGRIRKLKNINTLREIAEKYKETELQSVPVNEIVLYESILRPQGPLYLPVNKFGL